MSGRPGDRMTEINGGSAASYLVRNLCVPVFCLFSLIGLEAQGLLDFQGRRGIASVVRWNLRPVILGVERWAFVNVLKWVQKWAKSRFWVQKWVKWVKTHFSTHLKPVSGV